MNRLLPLAALIALAPVARAADVDFNRDVRPILANTCFTCHGPDEKERKGKLRLDTFDGATKGTAVVPGDPAKSELIVRVTTKDEKDHMPPAKTGKKLTAKEVETLRAWVQQGGKYATHWSYVKPVRPAVPTVALPTRNAIDNFLLTRLTAEGLKPSPEADKTTLIRRVALDLTGLPPTLEEVDQFLKDDAKDAYEKVVDRMLAKPAFGEHWARMWLDLARYADSAGYADDPLRTIWPYRDYVIKALNANKKFDRFTVEQLAGDLLPDATDETRTATGFHRNTMTNSEGGTSDEEFRNVAVVDRVNTTMAVWMGTSAACAQCHTHKYDPISQAEYFKLFAFLNNTEDADRPDESPLLKMYSDEQKKQQAAWEAEQKTLQATLKTPPADVLVKLPAWEQAFPRNVKWDTPKPTFLSWKDQAATVNDDGTILVAKTVGTDTYTVELPIGGETLSAVRLETIPNKALPGGGAGHGGGNFVLNKVTAAIHPPAATAPTGRYLRVELPGKKRHLMLAEVQAFSGKENVALKGTATQSSVDYEGEPKRAIDGETNGNYFEKNSVTHTKIEDNPWWEVDLKEAKAVDRLMIWNRTDGNTGALLTNFKVRLLDDKRNPVWEETVAAAPNPSQEWKLNGSKAVAFTRAVADYSQPDHDAALVLTNPQSKAKGWAVGGATDKPHALTLAPDAAVKVAKGSRLVVTIEQTTTVKDHTLGSFRVGYTADPGAAEVARTPADVLAVLNTPAAKRTADQKAKLTDYFVSVAPETKADREKLAAVTKSLADLKPAATVPVMKELAKKRVTKLQFRGSFMDLGEVVTEGTPAALHPFPSGEPLNRLGLAKWIVSPDNPLTARVTVNRFWEQIFGNGLVRTTEEFGTQGEPPSHPELLDWLAVEFGSDWDVKRLLKLLVTSAAYRQSSRVTPELREKDPDNRLYARGPRYRLSAEMVRDQALAVSGLLSPKMYGPSVRPPQPSSGLNAAFGGGLDWATSAGEDKHRRALYTEWRRTSPYPSMVTFDAPSREACTLRRIRTNTPLQALVTLNDPVYVEAAQALARKVVTSGKTTEERAVFAFRACTSRAPTDKEKERLVKLFEEAKAEYKKDAKKAEMMATDPIGPLPKDADVAELAAWTTVGNVLLNLDEMLMRR
jgi:mono/diheme cytochrome c family protein